MGCDNFVRESGCVGGPFVTRPRTLGRSSGVRNAASQARPLPRGRRQGTFLARFLRGVSRCRSLHKARPGEGRSGMMVTMTFARGAQSDADRRCVELAAIGADINADPEPRNGDRSACEECTQLGEHHWAHLRICLTCGHVGCCDSSPRRHAAAHFDETGHSVMRSAEPGEVWRWCYVHQSTD